LSPEKNEENKKSIETSRNKISKVTRINLGGNRAVEVEIREDGKARVLLCIGSEGIGIDEVVKGEEYHLWATDASGGYSAGIFHVWGDSTTFTCVDISEEGVKRGLFNGNTNVLIWKCTPEFQKYRKRILREEERLDIEIPNRILGTPYNRYLAYCLYYDYCGEPCKTGGARKLKGDMYEYWGLLMLLELLLKNEKEITTSDKSFYYQIRSPTASVFIKPLLPSYNRDEVIKNKHLPDRLIKFLEIPSWYDENKYLTPRIPDIIISEPSLEDIPGDYTEWENICPNIKFFIEYKSGDLNIDDVKRILWYSLAYKVPIVVFSQGKVNKSLKDRIELFKRYTNMEVQVFEEFTIGERRKWLNTLSLILFGREYHGENKEELSLLDILEEK